MAKEMQSSQLQNATDHVFKRIRNYVYKALANNNQEKWAAPPLYHVLNQVGMRSTTRAIATRPRRH